MTDPVKTLSALKHRLSPADWQTICAYVEAERETSDAQLEALQQRVRELEEAIDALATAVEFEVPAIRYGVDPEGRLTILMHAALKARKALGDTHD